MSEVDKPKMKLTKDKWIWMPHPAHFICSYDCRFILSTYIGEYIVSTIGEYCPDSQIRRIHAKVHDIKWYDKNKDLKGDSFDAAYFEKFGFKIINYDRKYETMVFKAEKSKEKCCPYTIIVSEEVDMEGYNKPEDARKGHMKLCNKWSQK